MQWRKKQYNSKNMGLIFSFVALLFHAIEEILGSILTLNSQSLNLCLKDLFMLESSDCSLEPVQPLYNLPLFCLQKIYSRINFNGNSNIVDYFQLINCKFLLFIHYTMIAITIPTSATRGFQNFQKCLFFKVNCSHSNCVFCG